jgi:23S rRNA pseudouridine955/2504/2580 synthase
MKIIVQQNDLPRKLLKFLFEKTRIPKICLYKLLRNKDIKINEKKVNKDYELQLYDEIEIYEGINITERIRKNLAPDNMIDDYIQEETDQILILNKPENIATQRGTNILYSIDEGILKYCEIRNLENYHLVHRLDKETSGLLVIAKNRQTATIISKLFEQKKIQKEYLAILCGKLDKSITVNQPILKINLKCIISEDGKEAITIFNPIKYILKNEKIYTVVKVYPKTGRTHQIRLHSHYLNLPILGDIKYDGENFERLMLHAHKIQIFEKEYCVKPIGIFSDFID